MKESQVALLRKVHAENAVIFSFIQGLITSQNAPALLLRRCSQAHDMMMATMLEESKDEIQLGLIADEFDLLMKRINEFIKGLSEGRIPR